MILSESITKWLYNYLYTNGIRRAIAVSNDNSPNHIFLNDILNLLVLKDPKISFVYFDNTFDAYKNAKEYGGILISTIDKTYHKNVRFFDKLDAYYYDVFPFLNVLHSDIIKNVGQIIPKEAEFLLWEWAVIEDEKFNIVSGEQPPHKNKRWLIYNSEQKNTISFLFNREKKTRHKQITRPSFSYE